MIHRLAAFVRRRGGFADGTRAPADRDNVGGSVLARHGGAVDQGGEAGGTLDATVVSPVPGQRSPTPVERPGLQPGELVATTGAAETYRQLVVDQRAAAPRQDRRALGETCPVLLAVAGGESSDTTPVRGDAAADLGVTRPVELTVSEFSEERWRRISTSVERCPRNAVEPRRFRWIPGRDGPRLWGSGRWRVGDQENRLQPAHGCSIGLFGEGKSEIPANMHPCH